MNKKHFAEMMEKALLGKKEVYVGKVDASYIDDIKAIHEDAKAFAEEMEKKVKAYSEECDKRVAAVWFNVYNALEIPESEQKEQYEIDPITGIVTRVEYGPSVLDKITEDKDFMEQFKRDVDRAHKMKEAKKDKPLH